MMYTIVIKTIVKYDISTLLIKLSVQFFAVGVLKHVVIMTAGASNVNNVYLSRSTLVPVETQCNFILQRSFLYNYKRSKDVPAY